MIVAVHRNLEECLSGLDGRVAEVGSFGDERKICNPAVLNEVSGADFLAEILRSLKLVDGLVSDFAGHRREQQVAPQLYAGLLDGFCRDQESRQRSLVIDHALAEQRVSVKPGAVIDGGIGIADAPAVLLAAAGIDVAVEDEGVTVAAARQDAEHIEAIRKHSDLSRFESFLLHPVEDESPDLGFASGRALDVAHIERELDELVAIDRQVDGVIRRLRHGATLCRYVAHCFN